MFQNLLVYTNNPRVHGIRHAIHVEGGSNPKPQRKRARGKVLKKNPTNSDCEYSELSDDEIESEKCVSSSDSSSSDLAVMKFRVYFRRLSYDVITYMFSSVLSSNTVTTLSTLNSLSGEDWNSFSLLPLSLLEFVSA
ncbi:hypothetical protein C0J52_11328 [Blattella germanica]|nr:hypothetical protein C0J52_11328 [Blattella germanica]